jgi:hypothetical protein
LALWNVLYLRVKLVDSWGLFREVSYYRLSVSAQMRACSPPSIEVNMMLPPSPVVLPKFVTLFFSGIFFDLPVNFDRILTESVNKLTES